jgi:tetratricopeptide (TPR) repeat protein
MDDMFQLSIELYDTKDKKVVWSDRWQEKWDNLTTIKMNLSDGLLKALDTKPKVEQKVETTNPEAYEFYLKAKHKYEKSENREDTEISIGLLNKALELDNNLLEAKNCLGWIYYDSGNNDKAMEIFLNSTQESDTIGNMKQKVIGLMGLGWMYYNKGIFNKSIDAFSLIIDICKKIDNKRGLSGGLNGMAIVYHTKGDFDKTLYYHNKTLEISELIGIKMMIVSKLNNIGNVYRDKGEYDIALNYYNRCLNIIDTANLPKYESTYMLTNIGTINYSKGDYKLAKDYLEQSYNLLNAKGLVQGDLLFYTTSQLFLTYKLLGIKYDVDKIKKMTNEAEFMFYGQTFILFQLFDDISYLETSYKQVQETANNLEPDVKAKFLSYPIPKAIVEEWEKVRTVKN